MFHFPAYPPQKPAVPAHDGRRVAPFGNPRIEAMLEAPRGLSHPQTSFVGTVCQGIHHAPLRATQPTAVPSRGFPDSKIARRQIIALKMITKRSISKPNSKRRVWRNRDKQKETPCFSCSRPLSSSQTATRHTFRHASNGRRPPRMGIEPHHNGNHRGVAVREPKSTPIPLPDGTGPSKPPISSTPASPHGTVEPFHAHGAHTGHEPCPEFSVERR